jgi:1-acyl-sn-glycerol-3-phosphate acyltransferase
MMIADLRKHYRRVVLLGEWRRFPPDRPVVLYANHHGFFDGHLLWYLTDQIQKRQPLTWMEELYRFPFFAAIGALPFDSSPEVRVQTLRETARQFTINPATNLIYFPEGRIHPREEGLLPLDSRQFERVNRVLGEPLWCPSAIHLTEWGESRPTIILALGSIHEGSQGDQPERLKHILERARQPVSEGNYHVILEGPGSPNERWDFRWSKRFFY